MKRVLCLMSLCLLLSLPVFATDMVGDYSIGGDGADYQTIQEAVTDLMERGLSGNVNVILNEGTYDEQILINDFNRTGIYWVTFSALEGLEPGSVVWTNSNATSADNYVLKVNNSARLWFSGIEFLSHNEYGTAIQLSGSTSNVTISSNIFSGAVVLNAANHSLISMLSDSNAGRLDDITIMHNKFYDGGFQIHHSSSTLSEALNIRNLDIHNNRMYRGFTGIFLQRSYYSHIMGNLIQDSATAIELSGGGYPVIKRNRIVTRTMGIKVEEVPFGVVGDTYAVYNNHITVTGRDYTGTINNLPAQGLWVINCSRARVYFNTIVLKTEDVLSSHSAYFSNTFGSYKNNQFIAYGNGAALYISGNDREGEDYNNVFAISNITVKSGSDSFVNYDDYLAAYSLSNSSMSLDPIFRNQANYRIFSEWLMNKGTPISFITGDFLGNERREDTPDIGAIEGSYEPNSQPLSGTYEIEFGNHFHNISSALHSASIRGISDDVVFLLKEPYEGSLNIYNIPGASETRKLTIKGDSESTWTYNPTGILDNYLVNLARASYIVFEDVVFENLNPNFGTMIKTHGFISNVSFEGCTFTGFNQQTDSTNRASFSSSERAILDKIVFDRCFFNYNAYGIRVENHSTYRADGFTVMNSEFHNNYTPIRLRYIDNVVLENNKMMESFYYGLFMTDCINLEATRNKVSSSALNTAFYLHSLSGSIQNNNKTNLIINNIIKLDSGRNGGPKAFEIGNSDYLDIMHNSIKIVGDNAIGISSYYVPNNTRIINNAINSIGGLALSFTLIPQNQENFVLDYNCYYTDGIRFVRYANLYNNFRSFREAFPNHDRNSYFANPFFNENMNSDSPWVKDKAFWTNRVTIDYFGNWRMQPYDIGANELLTQSYNFYEFDDNIVTVGIGLEYETLEEAFVALEKRGITSNDTLRIKLDNSVRTGRYQLNYIPRFENEIENDTDAFLKIMPLDTSGDNPRFTSPSDLQANESLFVLNRADRVIISGIDFEGNSQMNTSAVKLSGINDLITIDNCSFIGEGSSQTRAVDARNSVSSNVAVKNSYFKDFSNGYQQSLASSYHQSKPTNTRLINNSFENIPHPIDIINVDGLLVEKNEIRAFQQAMNLQSSADNVTIRRNRMLTSDFVGTFSNYELVRLAGLNGENNLYHNNILVAENATNRSLTGLTISQGNRFSIDNNSFYLEKKNNVIEGGAAIKLSGLPEVNVRNNVITIDGYASTLDLTSVAQLNTSHNVYYTLNSQFAKVDGQSYRTADEFFTETSYGSNSYFLYPFLDEDGYVKAEILKGKGTNAGSFWDIDEIDYNGVWDIGANIIQPEYSTDYISSNITVGEDYDSLQECLDAISRRGIDGRINLYINGDIHNDSFVIRPFFTQNSNDIVSIVPAEGLDDIVLHKTPLNSAENYIFDLRAVSNLIIKNLGFELNSSDFHTAINLTGHNSNINIGLCRFTAIATQSLLADRAFIRAHNSSYQGLTLERNEFEDGGVGIYVRRTTGDDSYENLNLFENKFTNLRNGVYLRNLGETTIHRNFFSKTSSNSIDVSQMNGQLQITRNNIRHTGDSGIHLTDITPPEGLVNYIYNNYVRTHSEATNPTSNIFFNNVHSLDLANNSFRVMYSGTQQNLKAIEKGVGCSNIRILNNIFYNSQSGYAAVINGADEVTQIDYNLFYAVDNDKVLWGSTIYSEQTDFPATGNFSNSIIADPLFEAENVSLLDESPAINAGIRITYITEDILGNPRRNPYDIGAWEQPMPSELDIPQNIVMTYNAENGTLEINWDEVQYADRYLVEASEDPFGEYLPIATTFVPYFGFFVLDIPRARFFRVRAMLLRSGTVSQQESDYRRSAGE